MKKRRPRVSEAVPVQVYLGAADRARLERLQAQLDATKAAVLRDALAALERELRDPNQHPLLKLSGIGVGDQGPDVDYDPAVEHDRYIAEYKLERWGMFDRKAERAKAKRRTKRSRGKP